MVYHYVFEETGEQLYSKGRTKGRGRKADMPAMAKRFVATYVIWLVLQMFATTFLHSFPFSPVVKIRFTQTVHTSKLRLKMIGRIQILQATQSLKKTATLSSLEKMNQNQSLNSPNSSASLNFNHINTLSPGNTIRTLKWSHRGLYSACQTSVLHQLQLKLTVRHHVPPHDKTSYATFESNERRGAI